MTDTAPKALGAEQQAYSRGWQDGNASALDACNPVIADLQSSGLG